METSRYESAVQIDEHALDKECINQPANYLKWAHRVIDLNTEISEVDAEADVLKAELDNRIRETPAKYGLEKVTESAIKAAIARDKDYNEKLKQIRELRHEMEMANAVLRALEHKKRSLTLLVELRGQGWHATPKTSERGREAVRGSGSRDRRRRDRESDDA